MPQDANRPLVFGSQLIGVLVVILTLVTRQAELRSTRPVGDKKQIAAQLDQNGDYFARLWDDPLAQLSTFQIASQEHSDAPRKALSPSGTMEADVGKNTPAPANGRTPSPAEQLAVSTATTRTTASVRQDQKPSQIPAQSIAGKSIFIWNILDARPPPEIKERRLRIRYGVVSALVAEGYLPTTESLLIPLGSPPVGYYETFRLRSNATAGKNRFQFVTLIWIPKQSTALNSALDPNTPALDPNSRQTIQKQIADQAHVAADGAVRFLHHGSSEDFDAFLAGKDRPENNVSFMRATIPFKYLQNQDTSRALSLRRISGDDQLVPKLVGELCLRIPSLNAAKSPEERPRVLIFTESDTSYSRAIASEVTDALRELARVEVYSYLRGLDGRPEDVPIRTKSEDARSNDVAAALLRGKAISEVSVGTSQFDYLRRLSLYLEQAKQRRADGEICAVGILGTDIYDKMLVLQAIRPQLPASIFFTTDLDALYLERDNENFTRNLVVASADSLEVNKDANDHPSRWKLPPMRDSYQTVLVKHVWEILEAGTAELKQMANEPVKVFEIVAGKNIELDPVDPSNFWGRSFLAWLPKWGNIVIFLVGLGNAFLVLWAISTRQVKSAEATNAPMNDGARAFLYTEVGIAMASLIFLLCWFVSPAWFLGQEPLSLEASVWPSITIRLLAFAVAIRLLMIASNSFVVHRPRIEKQLTKAVPSAEKLPLAEGLVKELAATCSSLLLEKTPPVEEKTFQQVVDKHFDSRARRKRIIWASLGYIAVSFVLFYRWPPAVPARGAFAFLAEKVVLALSVGLYIIHLMYCLDLHVSACTLLRTLRSFYSTGVKSLDQDKIDANSMLTAASQLTAIIGKTLLYPLTILILIIISRLTIFDNWRMAPSLSVTFFLGAAALILASLVLWYEGARLKSAAVNREQRKARAEEPQNIELISEGVFAPWHRQPIFAAIFSTGAVFGSLTVAEPLVRLFFGST
jgi:hypothetical protein